jgi:hypothetical protein
MSGGPSGRWTPPWGGSADRCASISRRTSHRSIRLAGLGRPRWAQGGHKARQRDHELVQRGYRGAESMLRQRILHRMAALLTRAGHGLQVQQPVAAEPRPPVATGGYWQVPTLLPSILHQKGGRALKKGHCRCSKTPHPLVMRHWMARIFCATQPSAFRGGDTNRP